MSLIQYKHTVKKIRKAGRKYRLMSDVELVAMTEKFRQALSNGQSEEDIMVDAFAVVSEASYRVLRMFPYDVQLIGGLSLLKGHIAQMKTGEGKTLVAALPSYLNALSGKGVHVVTCNDYLAERDAEEIGQIHRFLGLSVGCVTHEMPREERKKQYACDITYVTNSELGFDYLRDNLVTDKKDVVLRGLNYCIIDEADSILIDEARTPLIISGQGSIGNEVYIMADSFAKSLTRGEITGNDTKIAKLAGQTVSTTGDFITDEETKRVSLTPEGLQKAESYFGIDDIAASEYIALRHYIHNALHVNYMMKKDKDYIVRNGEVKIVDEFTGRILSGRRYSNGLHQAVEAKEGVEIQKESKTYASITYQAFFNKYDKKGGMTGTAGTSRAEFKEIYGLKTDIIPTNKKVIRKDRKDVLFITKEEKYRAVINEAQKAFEKMQPVLIGTLSIEVSEVISRLLSYAKIPHHVLNAKYHEQEAAIIARAGMAGAVTVATNMAGRGTDIKLNEAARKAGGLKVIGTERADSRRIDDQLIGRSGRQGDPGESVFILSLDDDLLRIYGDERKATAIKKAIKRTRKADKKVVRRKSIDLFIHKAQKNIEGSNYMVRKNVVDYDKILNDQRELIYGERNSLLCRKQLDGFINRIFKRTALYSAESLQGGRDAYKEVYDAFSSIVPINYNADELKGLSRKALRKHFYTDMVKAYVRMIQGDYGDDERRTRLVRQAALRVIDANWINHLEGLEQLRQGAALQSYAQTDPKNIYAIHAYDMFDEMLVIDTLSIVKTVLSMAVNT